MDDRTDPERICAYAEKAAANDVWWYRLGLAVGIAEGRRQIEAELEAAWLERRRIAPSFNPNSPTFAELQRRRLETA